MSRLTSEEVPAKLIRIARKHARARARACGHTASKVNSVDISLCKPHAPCTRDTSPSRRLPIHKYCNCQWEVGSTSSQRPRRVMAHALLVRAAPCAPESMAITIARSPHCHVHGAMTHHANLPLPFHEVSSRARARAEGGGARSPQHACPHTAAVCRHRNCAPCGQKKTCRGANVPGTGNLNAMRTNGRDETTARLCTLTCTPQIYRHRNCRQASCHRKEGRTC